MTKKIVLYFILILIMSCKTNDNSKNMIGTWRVNDDSTDNYTEIKIDKNYIILLNAREENPQINNSRLETEFLLIDNKKLNPKIDSFELICHSKDKIIMKRRFFNRQLIELIKIENEINEIDSVNFVNWKKKTISDFRERVKIKLGNDFNFDEKIDTFDFELPERTELEIKIDSIR
jgi:hypothetical protein